MDPVWRYDYWSDTLLDGLDDLGASKRNYRDMVVILLMAETLHQLRLVVYPTTYMVLHIPGGRIRCDQYWQINLDVPMYEFDPIVFCGQHLNRWIAGKLSEFS